MSCIVAGGIVALCLVAVAYAIFRAPICNDDDDQSFP